MLTDTIAKHIGGALNKPLPNDVAAKTSLHVLDTIAAMISGRDLAAGEKVIPYVRNLGGTKESTVIGTKIVTTAGNAALANGMLAHADETDDSHAASLTHPGCAVVPAALAMAEKEGKSGRALLRAVACGYDIGTRITMALGASKFFDRHRSSHSYGGLFGAAAAAGALAGLDAKHAAYVMSYAVQMASGNSLWRRDADHIEKAFDFGGMPAQAGVQAASMVQAGFTGSSDPLEGTPGLFAAFPEDANPKLAIEGLGTKYEIMETAIKKWSVGSPIQAALDSLEALLAENRFGPGDVAEIIASIPKQGAPVVDNRDMPDVNIQHQLALLVVDGKNTFHTGHDRERMKDPAVMAIRAKVKLDPRGDDKFLRFPRQAVVTVVLNGGRRLGKQTLHVRGTPGNPMTPGEVVSKARDLIEPVLGKAKTSALLERILRLDKLKNVAELRPLLQA